MTKILVIGESCRDIFVYCDAARLAPDIPVPILNIVNQIENPGMAMNVQRNIQSLGVSCDLFTNDNWNDITKTRYVHDKSNHMFFRVDNNERAPRSKVQSIEYDKYDIIVLSDYDKGFLSQSDIEYICNNHDLVFLDTKKILGPWAGNTAFIKINDFEFRKSKISIDLAPLLKKKIIRTMGADGCHFDGKRYPVNKIEVKDSSGAGDTFMAALVVKYTATYDIEESIKFANECASEIVQHRGVSVAQIKE